MSVVALDIGIKSIGIVISDETNTIAIPLENFIFKREKIEQAVDRVLKLINDYQDIELILIGYPLKTDGSKATISYIVDIFIKQLSKRTNIKLKKVDERYSTQRGVEILKSTIKDKEKIKELKDVAAAYVMLMDYLSLV